MSNSLTVSADIAASGMRVQAERLKVISQNMANADSVSDVPGGEPYRRQVVSFQNYVDQETGAQMVRVNKIQHDNSQFEKKYEPNHPAADANGYVLLPNVNPLIEMMDMKEAQRAYDANMNMMRTVREMSSATLDILK
ncbi:MAG: flagellar basal body rod protein FlgC [Alphaproteobacteria bacterium]|nr:flagellar basal body rod protein FlgC [Alphaproteobacteria bacterium]MBQ7285110.1 flagellar basal body rod protein FlgC [Alphaproteobacteria bacterium]